MRDDPDVLQGLSRAEQDHRAELTTTQFNHAELWYGYYLCKLKDKRLPDPERILAEVKILPFCTTSSDCFAMMKAKLQLSGEPLDEMDLLIASVCIANNGVLVTNNTKHFERINGLKLENWKKKK